MGGVPLMILHLLLFTLLGAAGAESKITSGVAPVVGVVGGDLHLPCHVTSGKTMTDEEVIWKLGNSTNTYVHRYNRGKDFTDHQPPEYRGRTSLSREALKTGDVSLTLTNLRLSDAGTYTCRVRAKTWHGDAPVTVIVEAEVSPPSVSVVSLGDGLVRLQCESVGWLSEPQVMWLDSRGQQIKGGFTSSGDPTALLHLLGDSNMAPKQQAEPTASHNPPSGLQVTSLIIVEERHGRNFTCVKSSAGQRRKRSVEVPGAPGLGYTADCSSGTCVWSDGPMFGNRRHDVIILSLLLLVVALAAIVYRAPYGDDDHADDRVALCGEYQHEKVVTAAEDISLNCQPTPAD